VVAVERHHGLRLYATVALQILAVAVAYYATARVGYMQELAPGGVTPMWPSAGVALAALLLLGLRMWPGILLGAFAAGVSIVPILVVAAISVANTLAPVCASLLLRRVGFRVRLDRLKDALALVFLGALAGMLVSATAGSITLMVSGVIPASGFWPTWWVWWAGDAMGVLVITPLLLLARRYRWPRGVRWYRWVEAAALLVGTLFTVWLSTRWLDVIFVAFPFLVWAVFRFQLAGAAPCVLIASTVATSAAAQEHGPFAGNDLLTNMIILQIFNGSVALTALLTSVVITERKRTRADMEQTCTRLGEIVKHLEQRATLHLRPTDLPALRSATDHRDQRDDR
jgi:integral membrane sensor domain MASE1